MSQCQVPLPDTADRYLGIEIECLAARQPHDDLITLPKLAGDKRFEKLVVHWEYFAPDYGYEVKFLVKECDVDELLPILCGALTDFGVSFNLNCGCHVHVDCRDRDKNQVYLRIRQNIERLKTFTKRNVASGLVAADRGYDTIECRAMEANLDAPRLLAYIHELIYVVDHGGPSTQLKAA